MKKTKKWIALFLSLILTGTLFSSTAAATVGDVDADEKITASDARLALRAAVGLDQLPDSRPADADHDEKITASDARLILRAAVGLEALTHPPMPENAEVKVTKVPTCTEVGKGEYVCVCGEILPVDLPKTEHTPDKAVKEKEVKATCASEGGYELAVYCAVCKTELSRDAVKTPKQTHMQDNGTSTVLQDATCLRDGLAEIVYRCVYCGTELDRNQVTIPKTEHTAGTPTVENVKAATCMTEGGYDVVTLCKICGELISRETVKTEKTAHELEVRKVDGASADYHNLVCKVCGTIVKQEPCRYSDRVYLTENEEPTCTDKVRYYTFCLDCGNIVNGEIAALGHLSDEGTRTVMQEKTCTENGVVDIIYACTRCHKILYSTSEIDPAPGHAFGEWKRIKEPTCTAYGTEERTCSRCGEKESRKVDMVDHTFDTFFANGDGTHTGVCSVCGEQITEDCIQLASVYAGNNQHRSSCTVCGWTFYNACEYGEKQYLSENTEPTCTKSASYTETCEVCGNQKTTVFEALGHQMVIDKTAANTYSLTGVNRLFFICSRCGESWRTDQSLRFTGQFGNGATKENMEIFNYFVNRLKTDWSAQGIKFSSVDHAVSTGQILSSKYDMNWLMKSKIESINLNLGPDEKIPTNKSEFDALLQEKIKNETQNSTVWPVVLTNDNFVLKKTELVSRLTAADVASITVETVTGYPGVGGFLPDVLPNTRTISMKDDGSFWIVGTPGDYNLKDMFLARLPDAESAVKVTLKLKDGSFNSMDAFVQNSNLKRIIDINEKDFEIEDISSSFEGMENIGEFNSDQSTSVMTNGTIVYFFEPETGKPLAATYDTGIDTVNTFTMNIKIALSTLDAGASISANSHTKTIYIFDPRLIY